MSYVYVFFLVLMALGTKAFQQRVMVADRYLLMSMIAGIIYVGEVSAVAIVVSQDATHIVAGALAAMIAVPGGVYLYNHIFTKKAVINEQRGRVEKHGHVRGDVPDNTV